MPPENMSRDAASLNAGPSPLLSVPRVERVTFPSAGETLVGDLYIPGGVSGDAPAPGVVVTGAWMTVKEQMPAVYAQALAEKGFAALTFDYRGWGESGGEPRDLESPSRKIGDIMAAVRFLAARPEIKPGGIGALGICASAGYMATAVGDLGQEGTVKALALVAPWLHDHDIVEQVYGGPEGVAKLTAVGREAAAQVAAGGAPRVVPAASLSDRSAVMFGAPYYTEEGRGLIPEWDNCIDLSFWEEWLTFDGIASAARITVPTTIVHSEAAAIPQGARRFYSALTVLKREQWLDDVVQFDFYDRPGPVRQAVEVVSTQFQTVMS